GSYPASNGLSLTQPQAWGWRRDGVEKSGGVSMARCKFGRELKARPVWRDWEHWSGVRITLHYIPQRTVTPSTEAHSSSALPTGTRPEMFEDDAVAPQSSWGSGFSILPHQPWSSHGGTPAPAIAAPLGGGVKAVTRKEAKSGEEGRA
ncbi:hypothetical protein LEMLEM_LOCUS24285, partial [Lemmus lemmus]